MAAIALAAHGGVLELSNAEGRCRLWLATGDKRRNLGADDATRVVDRLLQALQKAPVVSKQEREDPSWVLSLSEPHSAFYRRLSADTHHLIIQNEHAHVVGELIVGPDDVERWREALERFRDSV
jgi:hypothetical protein